MVGHAKYLITDANIYIALRAWGVCNAMGAIRELTSDGLIILVLSGLWTHGVGARLGGVGVRSVRN